MQVRVLFFGVLKELTGRSEDLLQVPAGASLGQIFDQYAQQFETLRSARPSILFARNREFVTADALLAENDEIAFLPPVSGGASARLSDLVIKDEPGHFFAITREPIDSKELVLRQQRPEDGAVVVFEGVVRNNTKGRETLYLEYECYENMAVEQMARIGRELANDPRVGTVALVHRLGRLEIGEASVVVVVTAPHRGPAFEAALTGINRLKKEVPIWKKEFFADGAVWVDGEWDDALLALAQRGESNAAT